MMFRPQAPVVLRLVFHDAATFDAAAGDGGVNASVRLELDRPENKGLKRGWRVIEAAMAGEGGTCRGAWSLLPCCSERQRRLLPTLGRVLTACAHAEPRILVVIAIIPYPRGDVLQRQGHWHVWLLHLA